MTNELKRMMQESNALVVQRGTLIEQQGDAIDALTDRFLGEGEMNELKYVFYGVGGSIWNDANLAHLLNNL